MALTQRQRNETINYIVTNCDCWQHQGDKEVLDNFTDEKLVSIKEHVVKEQQAIAVANAAVAGFSAGDGNAYRLNPETGKWEKRIVGNKKKPYDDEEDEDEDDEDMEENSEDEEDEDEMEKNERREMKKMNKNRMKGKKTTTNSSKPKTMEQIIRELPREMQDTFRAAQEIEQREKAGVINQLLVNVGEVDKKAHQNRLMQRSLEELRNDLSLVPKLPDQEEINQAAGKSRSSKRNLTSNGKQLIEDMLIAPAIDWKEVGDTSNSSTTTNNSIGGDFDGEDTQDEEWIKNAPANIRSMVQNAMAVENRERRKLIEQLTENIADDEEERRLIHRLEKKSLEELRDLMVLTPKKESRVPNYFGSSPATTTNASTRNSQSNDNEDLLPLPTMDWKAVSQAK